MLKEVRTAGGLLTEEFPHPETGEVRPYVWLAVSRDTLEAWKTDPEAPVSLQLIKGHVDPGETPDQTAVREVYEEAGLVAIVGTMAGEVYRDAWEYADGVRKERVRKRITMFIMKQMSILQNPDHDEHVVLVQVDHELLDSMKHPEEAQLLARYFGIDWQPRQAEATQYHVA